ncbi:hypothetical protein L218DRAFT_872203 [Marasmius fiardii PR-910]|nr:hypothetical protein L218DRAFT_872203 [Marasmius fiardii PR-910]
MSLISILEHQNITGSVLLTPRKRKSQHQPSAALPSNADIFRWVLTPEATAPCYIRDVFQMRHHQDKGSPVVKYENALIGEHFFWLKRVPCRSVKFLGLVVGVQVLQNRIIYTVDDGTSVIDCLYRCSPSPQSPSKKKNLTNIQPPKPMFYTGQRVRVTGKIIQFHDNRQVVIDSIGICTSANEQPVHWKHVLSLHKSYYLSSEPFTIPTAPNPMPESEVIPQTLSHPSPWRYPESYEINRVLSTGMIDPLISQLSTYVYSQSPRKLHHPSRLHSRDLTAITFRIYVKHYIDNYSSIAHAESNDDENEVTSSAIGTPTKGLHRSTYSERTPRPSRSIPVDLPNRHSSSKLHPDPASSNLRGFTLSFLRRVSELSDMAHKVVRAEAKRRAREIKKKEKHGTKTSASSSRQDQTELSVKMKRLWRTTIIQLAREGSIVLWNGPVYPIASAQQTSTIGNPWREGSTLSSFDLASSTIHEGTFLFSAAGNNSRLEEEEDVVISEPEPDEESYVSLTPRYFAIEVGKAIKVLWKCKQQTGSTSLGPTKQRILSFLRRDGMWEQVGEWNVEEALEVLREEGRAWVNDCGVWDLVL